MKEKDFKEFEDSLKFIADNWRTLNGNTTKEKMTNAIGLIRMGCIAMLDMLEEKAPTLRILTEEEYQKKVEEGKKISFAPGGKY